MGNFKKSSDVDVYQNSFELLVAVSKASISFAREYKYTFGERIINCTLDALSEVQLANDEYIKSKKVIHIDYALKALAQLDILRKACAEIPNLSINVYTEQMENIANIKKQLRSRRDYCEMTK